MHLDREIFDQGLVYSQGPVEQGLSAMQASLLGISDTSYLKSSPA